MKFKELGILIVLIVIGLLLANNVSAQDPVHEATMSMLREFFADPAARAAHAAKNPEARQAEQRLSFFPPHIQKKLDKVVLMIMQESGAKAGKHVDALGASGPQGAFDSFSPAVQREIEAIAKELEKDPEFMKKAGSFK